MPADRPPVTVLASASALGRGALTVRRHADGRILVHGSRDERRTSELLPPGATMVDLVAAIRRVHAQLAPAPAAADAREQWGGLATKVISDLGWWAELATQVIDDLPPEEI